jgi:hypothetical protein
MEDMGDIIASCLMPVNKNGFEKEMISGAVFYMGFF